MVSVPPSGMASTALNTRFMSASRISLSTAAMRGSAGASSICRSMTAPRCCAMSLQRARVRSTTCSTSRLRSTGTSEALRLARAIELAHARDRLRDVVDGALDGLELLAPALAQSRFAFQQRFGVQRHGRDGVVDVVRDAAGHLPQRAQPLLLHHLLLGLAQVVVGLLQGAVELRLVRGQRGVFAGLAQEFALAAAEGVGVAARADQHAEHLALDQERRDHERAQAGARERCAETGNGVAPMSGS